MYAIVIEYSSGPDVHRFPIRSNNCRSGRIAQGNDRIHVTTPELRQRSPQGVNRTMNVRNDADPHGSKL
jgi:hypothetical protein